MLWLLFTTVQLSVFRQYYITVSRRSIVTMAQSRVVSEIFNVEKYRDLEIGVRGHSRSSKVLSFDRPCMVSY